ncbi:MAG: hypothetical protein AAF399_08255, partial [Bacteroidota bacterium]
MKKFFKPSQPLFSALLFSGLFGFMMFFLGSFSAYAQAPMGFNYQAVVRDGGTVLNNQVVDVRFTLVVDNVETYQELHSLTSDGRGLIQTVVGTGTPLVGTMEDVPWESGMVSLKVAMDAGNGFLNLGTTPMESVPFSMFANQVDDLENHIISDLDDVDDATP